MPNEALELKIVVGMFALLGIAGLLALYWSIYLLEKARQETKSLHQNQEYEHDGTHVTNRPEGGEEWQRKKSTSMSCT